MTRSVEAAAPGAVAAKSLQSKSKKWTPVEPLPEEISIDSLKQTVVLPALVRGNDDDDVVVQQTVLQDFVLGKNIHGTCLEITEPEMDDEVTGDRDAYMAGILARYRKTLVEKTKYHLGTSALQIVFLLHSLYRSSFTFQCFLFDNRFTFHHPCALLSCF